MKKLTLSIAFVLLSYVGAVSAANVYHTSTIKAVYPLADGRVVFVFNTDSSSCTNDNTPNYYYLGAGYNSVSPEGFKNIYSSMLAAAAQKNEVLIAFDDSSSGCYINRVWVKY